MKLRVVLAAALLLAAASSSFALSPEYSEWGSGPAHYLMTQEEASAWKAISTDDAAKAFVDLFWARRDPTPGTPANEFREEFERRVAFADANFPLGKKKGSLTDRGRIYIVLGPPKRVERRTANPGANMDRSVDQMQHEDRASQSWIYEGDSAREIFNIPAATLEFSDRLGNGDFRLQRGRVDTTAAQERALARAITQPNLTSVPAASPAPQAAAAPVPAAVSNQLSSEALRTAVTEFKAAKANPYKTVYVNWGEYVTSTGEVFTPVMLYVPKDAGLTAGQTLTFFGVVEDASGAAVASVEKPLTVTATGEDFFVDTSLTLPGGKLKGYFGLADAGKPVAMAVADMELSGSVDQNESGVSQLILSNNIYPLAEAQAPTDPFAFGGMKVVPKGNRTFTKKDELWYFFTVRNPALPAVEAAAGAEGAAEAVALPKLQVALDIEGTDPSGQKLKTKRMPLSEAVAVAMQGAPGQYGVGSSMLLESFEPGSYTLKLKVIDTVGKKTWNLTETFRVVE
jgi:GWxTD domain-containing protein